MIKFLDLYKQYEAMRPEIDAAMAAVIAEGSFVGGPKVKAFEENFAAYIGVPFCVGCANGTDALEIILEALALPPGSEVIVPANTFIATAEAVARAGHRVVFCDADPVTYTISIDDARRRITAATKAVIPVHLYGHPCDMEAVMSLAGEHGLRVIEDCAQAHGAEFRGKRVATFGHAAAFSFYPGKVLGAYGDAGAIVTSDEAFARRCRMIANHGRTKKYDHEFPGRNSRLDGIQAAILDVKLRSLDAWIADRQRVAELYLKLLSDCPEVVLPGSLPAVRHAWHLFVIRVGARDDLRKYLAENGIETGIHYPIPLTRLAAFASCGQADEPLFVHRTAEDLLSLPIGEHLSSQDVMFVSQKIKDFYAGK